MKRFVLLFVAFAVGGCSSLTPTNDPVYLRVNDIEARLIRIERVLENDSLISLAQDIAELRGDVQRLVGEVETLGYELDGQADRQRDLYVDLDERLSEIEAAQARLAQLPRGASGPSAASMTDQQAYDAAFALIQQQNWSGAQAAFERFLATYPASALRSNAQYWLAESLYAQLEFSAALGEFQAVLDDYPQSSKVPDALLKIGFSYYEMGDNDRARQALVRVVREFPATSAAESADQRLRRIADETG